MAEQSRILRQEEGSLAGRQEVGEAIRVFVLATVRIYRDGIADVLRRDGGFDVVGLAADPSAALAAVTELRPDVAVLDLASEAASATIGALQERDGPPAIVGLVLYDDVNLVVGAAALGVRAFVGVDQSLDELIETVTAAAGGAAACPPSIATLLFDQLDRRQPGALGPEAALTGREREIASCLARGLSNKEIARLLVIEPATVKNHVHNVLSKLGVGRRAEVAVVLRGMDRLVHAGSDGR